VSSLGNWVETQGSRGGLPFDEDHLLAGQRHPTCSDVRRQETGGGQSPLV
jgi:hypothetical protein